MAFQSVPSTIQVEVRYSLALTQIENILYFKTLEPYTEEYIVDLVEAVYAAWADDVMTELSSELTLREVYAKGLENIIDFQALYVPITPDTGDVASSSLPGSVACCVAFKSGLTGRSSRGRIYVPGIPESAVTGNTFNSGYAAALANGVAAAVLDVETAFPTAQHVIVSRVTGGVVRPEGATFAVTEYQSTDNFVDSRRSRVK